MPSESPILVISLCSHQLLQSLQRLQPLGLFQTQRDKTAGRANHRWSGEAGDGDFSLLKGTTTITPSWQ
jgi:hypothetical protein